MCYGRKVYTGNSFTSNKWTTRGNFKSADVYCKLIYQNVYEIVT